MSEHDEVDLDDVILENLVPLVPKNQLDAANARIAELEEKNEGFNRTAKFFNIEFDKAVRERDSLSSQLQASEERVRKLEKALKKAAAIASKAAWLHFHSGTENHVCTKSDWSYADAVEKAVLDSMPKLLAEGKPQGGDGK